MPLFISNKKLEELIDTRITEVINNDDPNLEWLSYNTGIDYKYHCAKAFFLGSDALLQTYGHNEKVLASKWLYAKNPFWSTYDEDQPLLSVNFGTLLCKIKEKILFCNGINIGGEYNPIFTNMMREVAQISGYSGNVVVRFHPDGTYDVKDVLLYYTKKNENLQDEIVTIDNFMESGSNYTLYTYHGYGYNIRKLYKKTSKTKDSQVLLTSTRFTANMSEHDTFNTNVITAVEFKSKSLLVDNLDQLNAIDEAWSHINDTGRRNKAEDYIPENLLKKTDKGSVIMPNKKTRRFTLRARDLSENNNGKIERVQSKLDISIWKEQMEEAKMMILTQEHISVATLGELDNVANISFEARQLSENSTLRTREQWLNDLGETIDLIFTMWQATIKLGSREIININSFSGKVEILPYIIENTALSQEKMLMLYDKGIVSAEGVAKFLDLPKEYLNTSEEVLE